MVCMLGMLWYACMLGVQMCLGTVTFLHGLCPGPSLNGFIELSFWQLRAMCTCWKVAHHLGHTDVCTRETNHTRTRENGAGGRGVVGALWQENALKSSQAKNAGPTKLVSPDRKHDGKGAIIA